MAEVPENLLLGPAPLLVAKHGHRLAVIVPEAAHNRWVVGKPAIAMELGEVSKQPLDIVEHARAVGMTRDLHALPRLEASVDLGAQLARPRFKLRDRRRALRRLRHQSQRLDFLPENRDRLFEVEQ